MSLEEPLYQSPLMPFVSSTRVVGVILISRLQLGGAAQGQHGVGAAASSFRVRCVSETMC
jgi:hypothetical protein